TPNFLLVREAVYQLTYMPENLDETTLAARLPYPIFKKASLLRDQERTEILRKLAAICQVWRLIRSLSIVRSGLDDQA
ncbi:MAG TPA: hypothetical protein PLX39_17895, partial [Pyrinomonadaceae bacterium]|nr:hypothetical protein [Pyrinomonadaceae bacterium]